ncbi:integrin alpha-X-like [Mustelus asterias]
MLCVVDQLTQEMLLTFELRGYLSLNETTETEGNTHDLQTVGRLSFDEQKYIHGVERTLNDRFLYLNVTTHVEIIREVNLLPIIAGGAVGGLILLVLLGIILWKVGFFNRKYKERIADGGPAAGGDAAESSVPLNPAPNPAPTDPPAAAP